MLPQSLTGTNLYAHRASNLILKWMTLKTPAQNAGERVTGKKELQNNKVVRTPTSKIKEERRKICPQLDMLSETIRGRNNKTWGQTGKI